MNKSTLRKQQGLSLIELMIALVLGLIVVSGLFNMYLGSTRSSHFSDGLQRMQENGRYGISTLQKGVRLAGYSPDVPLAPFDIAASDDTTLVAQMRRAYDCNGGSTASTGGLAVNTYSLDTSSGDPLTYKLVCEGNSPDAAPMTLIEGVEAFRVLYGIDSDDDDIPEKYIPYNASINARQVSSLRFALLVNSGTPIRTRPVTDTYVLLDTEIPKSDRVARTVFTSTVKLRNRR
jgi:type IV pilus assembly protein PilW